MHRTGIGLALIPASLAARMNRRDLIKASAARAAIALNIIGWRGTYAEPAVADEVYIDPSAIGTGHSGTYTDPYSTADALIYLSLLNGDLGNRHIRFKAGTTFVGPVVIQGCDNYYLEPYGDGAAPIISNHVEVSATWTQDASWADDSDDVWSLANASWGGGQTGVVINDGGVWRACAPRSSKADLALVYECNETAYPTAYPFTCFYDSAAGGTMWVHVPHGFDMNANPVRRPVAGEYGVDLSTGSGATVRYLDIGCAAHGGLFANGVSGLLLDHVVAYNISGNNSTDPAQDVFNIVGTLEAARATDITMRNCIARRSGTTTYGHALEIAWLDNVTVDDFTAHDVPGHGVEFWDSNRNVIIRRMRARQAGGSMVFITQGDHDGINTHHDGVTIENCECVQRANYLKHGTAGGESGGYGIYFGGVNRKLISDVHIYNNSFDLDNQKGIYAGINADAGAGNNAVTIKNNIFRFLQITAANWSGIYAPVHANAASEWVMDNNIYQFSSATTNQLWVLGIPASSQAAWRSAWDAIGDGSNEDHSLVLTASDQLFTLGGGTVQATDLSLINELVAAVGLGDSSDRYTPTTDILGTTRDSSPDAGAYEYVVPIADIDGDGVADGADNCTSGANPTQLDADGDGYGNMCDADLNNNGVTNTQDFGIFRTKLGTDDAAADLNGNGIVNNQDYEILSSLLGGPPGPSGLHP